MRVNTLLPLALLVAGCSSTHRDVHVTGRPIGEMQSLNDYVVNIEIQSEQVTGAAKGGVLFGFIETGSTDYAEYITYDGDSFVSLSSILGSSKLDQVKRAAVRDACSKAGCDVLAYPMFEWSKDSALFVSEYSVEVRGYPGFIREIKNYPREIVPGKVQLGPDGDPVPEQNRYRIEGADGAVLHLGAADGVGGASSGARAAGSRSPGTFGWRG